MQAGHEGLELVIEPIQIRRKAAQLGGVDSGFSHALGF
jgi:hypothetical protein